MNYSKAVLLSLKVVLFCCCGVVVLFLFCFVCLFVCLFFKCGFFFGVLFWGGGCFGKAGGVLEVFWGVGGVYWRWLFFRVVVMVVDGRCVRFFIEKKQQHPQK